MTEQRERYAVLTSGLVIPKSVLRAKMESEKQLRNGIFYALSTLNHTYSSELLNGILTPPSRFFGIRLAETFNLLPKRMKLRLHKFRGGRARQPHPCSPSRPHIVE